MATIKFRFGETDREAFGGDWFELDLAALGNVDSGLLEDFEEQTGYTVLQELPEQLSRSGMRALRAAIWLTLRIGGRDEAWETFKPNILAMEFEDPDGEGEQTDPPPGNRAQRRAANKSGQPSGT